MTSQTARPAAGPEKIYLAGPVTGRANFNRAAFAAAQDALEQLGHEVINPTREHLGPHATHGDYMRHLLPMMLGADVVALMPEWQTSKGARAERDVAELCGLPVVDLSTYLGADATQSLVAPQVGPAADRELYRAPTRSRTSTSYEVRWRIPGVTTDTGRPVRTTWVRVTWYPRDESGDPVVFISAACVPVGHVEWTIHKTGSYANRPGYRLPNWLRKLAFDCKPAWADTTGWNR